MALYSEKVMDHFQHPRNVGIIENADGIGEVGNAKCGDIMKIYLKIDDDKISDVKFETFGCGSAIASDDLGIKAAIATVLGPILGNASWPIMVILCVAVSTIFTNFTNGMPVSFTINAICIPLACTMQMEGRGNATILGVATILASMCAFLTNGAIAYAPILLGREEMTSKFIFTKGVVTNILFIVLASLICIVGGYVV